MYAYSFGNCVLGRRRRVFRRSSSGQRRKSIFGWISVSQWFPGVHVTVFNSKGSNSPYSQLLSLMAAAIKCVIKPTDFDFDINSYLSQSLLEPELWKLLTVLCVDYAGCKIRQNFCMWLSLQHIVGAATAKEKSV